MEDNKIYMIPFPILPSINCQTATAIIKPVKTNFIFLLNMSIKFKDVKGIKNI